MEMYNKLVELVQSMEVDLKKFYEKDNDAAGTRLRKTLMDIRTLSQEFRVAIQAVKNSR